MKPLSVEDGTRTTVAECKFCERKIRKFSGDWEHVHSALMSCYKGSLLCSASPKKGTVRYEH